MRAVLITRIHNCYRIGVSKGHNGYTYTNGGCKEAPNNCLFGLSSFYFNGAPGIPSTWYRNDYEGCLEDAKEVARKANLAYGFPIVVINHKKEVVEVFDDILFDEVSKEYMLKEDLQELQWRREKEEEIHRLQVHAESLLQNLSENFDSELR